MKTKTPPTNMDLKLRQVFRDILIDGKREGAFRQLRELSDASNELPLPLTTATQQLKSLGVRKRSAAKQAPPDPPKTQKTAKPTDLKREFRNTMALYREYKPEIDAFLSLAGLAFQTVLASAAGKNRRLAKKSTT